MKVNDQILADCEVGKKIAEQHEQTAHGLIRDANDQDNIFGKEAAKEAVDHADFAGVFYQDAIRKIGSGETGIAESKRASEQLRLCELALEKAAGFLKKSEGDQ